MSLSIGTATLTYDGSGTPTIGGSGIAKRILTQLQPVRLPGTTIVFLRSKGATASETQLISDLTTECVALATAWFQTLTIDAVVSGSSIT